MKKIMLSLMTIGLFAVCCQQNTAGDESENLKMIVKTYFDGIKNRDAQIMKGVTTSDFLLFEDGRVFNNDSLINFMNSFSTFSADFTLDNFKVRVNDDIGHVSYYNRGDLTLDTTRVTVNWLESATFTRIDGQWKMDFLHSTARK